MTSDQHTTAGATAPKSSAERGAEATPPARSLIRWESGLVVVLIAVLALGAWKVPHFLDSTNIFYVGLNMGEIAIMALPVMLIIITGEIDLSVASMLGLSGVVMGQLFSLGTGIWVAILAALAVGALGGALNGFLIARMGLPSIAVTIGTLTLYRGIAEVVLAPRTVTGFPTWLTDIGVEPVVGDFLPFSTAVFIVLAVITGIVLHATGLGRSIYAIGLQSEAAQFAGVRVQRIKFSLFVLSGVICAFAGILFTAKNASVSYDAGTGLELTVVAIVLFGGVSIFGGRGTLIGVVLSVVIIGFLQQAITQLPASSNIQNMKPQLQAIVIGILLLFSVILPNGGEAIGRFRDWVRRRSDSTPALSPAPPHTSGPPDPSDRSGSTDPTGPAPGRPSAPTERKAAP